MSEKNLELAKKILQQDINASSHFFEKNNFISMNIVANRYLENCIIFDDYRLCLPGVFIKDMANDYQGIIARNKSVLNSSKVIGKKMIEIIKANFNNETDSKKLWEEFQTFTEKINEFHKNELESEVYTKNIELQASFLKKY